MKLRPGARGAEMVCPNCGTRRPPQATFKGEPKGDEPPLPKLPPQDTSSRVSKPKRTSTHSKMKRLDRAKQFSDLRQISKDLTGRVGDLQIQFDRKLTELQELAVRLEKFLAESED